MANNQAATLLFLYAETPLHPGTGASLGVVDLPIQRERTTHYPLIPASSLKGVLRAMATPPKEDKSQEADDQRSKADLLFGPDDQKYAGATSFGDAKLLLFPVRALAGVFVWITCPAVLARLKRDLSLAVSTAAKWQIPDVAKGEVLLPKGAPTASGQIALEEFLFKHQENATASEIADWLSANALPASTDFDWWRNKLKRSLVIMNDDDYRDFVTTATEIVARTRLEAETKKVMTGALWYQEFLPSETIFYSVIIGQDARDSSGQSGTQMLDTLKKLGVERIQIGGDETTGKGFCKLRYL